MNHEAASDTHVRFQRAVRGALVAEAALDQYRTREVGWEEVRESWTRLQRNGKPTPWDELVGAASARTGKATDMSWERWPQHRATGGEEASKSDGRRLYIDDHRYYLELPRMSIVEAPSVVRQGAFTWAYVGQQIYSDNAQSASARWEVPESRPAFLPVAPEPDEQFPVGSASYSDSLGRLWVLQALDNAATRRADEAYWHKVRTLFGPDTLTLRPPRGILRTDFANDDETPRFMQPMGWRGVHCPGDTESTASITDSPLGDIKDSTTPLTSRGQKVVSVQRITVTPTGGTGSTVEQDLCSGTMVDENLHILTAAHCVTGDDGSQSDANTLFVCIFGNRLHNASTADSGKVGCYPVGAVHPSHRWQRDGGVGIASDFAILELQTALPEAQQVGFMALSSAGASDLAGTTDIHRGYPGFRSDCSLNQVPHPVDTTTNPHLIGARQFVATGRVDTVFATTINYETSTGHGMSGGPHYICPGGDGTCDDSHFITGIEADSWQIGFDGASNGPRAAHFASFVANNT